MRSASVRRRIAGIVLVAVLIGAGSAAALVQPPATTRVAVSLDDPDAADAVAAVGGEIVAEEPDIGYLFADIPSVADLRRRVDAPVHVDPGATVAGTPNDARWDDQWGPRCSTCPRPGT